MDWNSCTFEPNAWLRWIECHPGAASWAQAVFSVLAIVVAIALPWITGRTDKKRRALEKRARSEEFLVTMSADVMMLWAQTERLKNALPQLASPPTHNTDLNHLFSSLHIDMPQRMLDAMPLTLDLDTQIVEPFRALVLMVSSHNSFVKSFHEIWPLEPERWAVFQKGITSTLEIANNTALQLRTAYDARFGVPVPK